MPHCEPVGECDERGERITGLADGTGCVQRDARLIEDRPDDFRERCIELRIRGCGFDEGDALSRGVSHPRGLPDEAPRQALEPAEHRTFRG